ncbi:MAG TPA: patatin-like phospholipase family protein [Burkholderiaceae bacterium]|nr:patatin-like phospholipase family protein [Burkholderiaceae bacterium]
MAASYPVVALVLQGGGALGAYQGGVVEGLAEAGIEPGWIAGISIGAFNAAILAGNPPERRVERLREFWETICRPPVLPVSPVHSVAPWVQPWLAAWEQGMAAVYAGEAWRALLEGQNGFFRPRVPPPWALGRPGPDRASWYDTTPLRETLERFADFDRINAPGAVRVSVGAVDVETGNFAYFDNRRERLRPEHVMASGALPPGFPAVRVDGRWYWDGGLVSNTPLSEVLGEAERPDALVFQIDLWSARGEPPRDLFEVANRQKDIQFSSRTRAVTDRLRADEERAALLRELIELVPRDRRDHPAVRRALAQASDRRVDVIQLIYDDHPNEGHYKDYQFGLSSMRDHWRAGLHDLRETLARPDWLERPPERAPFATHDVHRTKKKPAPKGAG